MKVNTTEESGYESVIHVALLTAKSVLSGTPGVSVGG